MNLNNFDLSDLKEKNYFSLLAQLVDYISARRFKPGDRLPQESLLADELHTNRSTLREMLRVLETMGVIESQRGSGNIYVGDMEIGFMNLFFVSNILFPEKLYEFSSLRAIIEAEAIELFIQNATDTDIYKLDLIYSENMSCVGDKLSSRYLESHILFHEQLLKYYNNETAKQLVRSHLRMQKRDFETTISKDPKVDEEYRNEIFKLLKENSHAAILDAVKAKDIPRARQLVINHAFMSGTRNTFIK